MADNIWRLASAIDDLASMVTDLTEAIRAAGWDIPFDRLQWCTTMPDGAPRQLHVPGGIVPRAARAEGLKVLGSWASCDGYCHRDLQSRL